MTGIIYKGIGGFYYVKAADGAIIECKARGIFRKENLKPVAGDRVRLASEAGTVYIDEILPRKNVFVRPAVANLDQLFLIVSTTSPKPSYLVMDKLLAVAVDAEVQPVLVVTKGDLEPPQEILEAYRHSGIPTVVTDVNKGAGLPQLEALLPGKLSVLCGNSGVGKSTLLNALLPEALRATGNISQKLGRGRHTTREVELFEVAGGLVADTPGFASFDLQRAAPIPKENLQFAFPDVEKHMQQCRFTGCSHVAEQGCAVRQAVQEGEISLSRYESYVLLYEDAKQQEKKY